MILSNSRHVADQIDYVTDLKIENIYDPNFIREKQW